MGEGTMKAKHILLGCALVALSANAMAARDNAGKAYVGVGYTALTISPEGDAPDFDLGVLGVRGGYYFHNYFSVEGRLGFGVADDTKTIDDIPPFDLTVDQDYNIGVYAVGHLPLSDRFKLYGLVGFTKAEVTLSVPGESISSDDSDFSYGAGLEFDMTKNWSLAAEYTAYFSDAEVSFGTETGKYDASGLAIAVNYNF
jgi:opacity protein-like surface antigen